MDGDGDAPEEWVISRICEEFNCLPNAAVQAILEDEGGLLFKIMDLRAYARAKDVYDTTPMEKRPKNATIEKVSEITMEIAKERIAAYQKKIDGPNS